MADDTTKSQEMPAENSDNNRYEFDLVSDSECTMSGLIAWQEFQSEYEQTFATFRQNFRIKGFRPGREPIQMVNRAFDNSEYKIEFMESVLQPFYRKWIDEAPARPISAGEFLKFELEVGKGIHFETKFEVLPTITPPNYVGETLDAVLFVVDDAKIDEEVSQAREANAVATVVETGAEEGFYADINLQTLDDEGNVKDENSLNRYVKLGESIYVDDVMDAFRGKKEGETFEIFPDVNGKQIHYQVTINSIERQELPELDDEFAYDASNGTIETLDEYLADIRGYHEADVRNETTRRLRSNIIRFLLAPVKTQPPPSIVRRMKDDLWENFNQRFGQDELPEDTHKKIDKLHEAQATIDTRWVILRQQFILEYKIEVSEDEVEAKIKEYIELSDDSEQIREYYENENTRNNLHSSMVDDRLFEKLEADFEINFTEKTMAEFLKEEQERDAKRLAELQEASEKGAAEEHVEPMKLDGETEPKSEDESHSEGEPDNDANDEGQNNV